MRERGTSNAHAAINARHVVEYDIHNNFDSVIVTGRNHVLKLGATTTFAFDLVRDSLIVGPPLRALSMLHCGTNCWRGGKGGVKGMGWSSREACIP